MGTRITSKIISNNAAYNIQSNKKTFDKVATQQATEKKINDPSDDPVVAMRALRFHSALADTTQYLDKNLSDANSWVKNTETALSLAVDLMKSVKAQYTAASNDTDKTSDREIYLNELRSLVNQYYSIGNTTNEDRYLFTGYRTSDSLTFTENNIEEREKLVGAGNPAYDYVIEEKFDKNDIKSYSFASKTVSESDINDAVNGNTPTNVAVETDIELVSGYRIRLAYDSIDDSTVARTTTSMVPGEVTITTGGSDTVYNVEYIEDDADAAGADGKVAGDKIFVNTKTGMMIFGENIKTAMAAADDISFTYEKTSWNTEDLKPEHYFNCVDVALNEANPTKYPTILVYDDAGQKMEYAVGNAQSIGINTNAKDAFMTDVGRDIDELADIINNVKSAERKVEEIKGKLNDAPNNETLKYLKAAADKELNFFSNQMKEFIAGGITRSGEYFDQVNLASTQAGTVANRITIISDRLSANKETITEQASENENVNISDIAVEMQNVQMVYNASLIVTGKISRQSLLDYI